MGLKGVEGSVLHVWGVGDKLGAEKNFSWERGKVTAIFDDSFDHSVETPASVEGSRFVLAVGVLHPTLRKEPWRYAGAFNRKTSVDEWEEEEHQMFQQLARAAG